MKRDSVTSLFVNPRVLSAIAAINGKFVHSSNGGMFSFWYFFLLPATGVGSSIYSGDLRAFFFVRPEKLPTKLKGLVSDLSHDAGVSIAT